eukprot:GHRR01028377.1.p1 GENE.GHRR01028377.1~~GHRR01028377.1.p1  ORF type:complete len:183 (+),score=37.86 GHRR01028377.1:135-683(+)
MKAVQQLFGHRGPKQQSVGPLTNKTVQVGSFQVICEALLGSGGYADIYRVTDISSGHKYALKHLRLAGDVENIQEVQREAKTMAKLRGHPNILRLHAVAFAGPKGNETDGFFLVSCMWSFPALQGTFITDSGVSAENVLFLVTCGIGTITFCSKLAGSCKNSRHRKQCICCPAVGLLPWHAA